MADDKLDFLDETQATEPEQDAPEAVEPEQSAPEPIAEPEPTGEELEATPPVAAEEKPNYIPVTALLDEREKRQKAERELEELRRWREQQERQSRQQQQPKPDFFDNPEQAISQHVTAVKLQQSRFLAEREFGEDLVKEAYAYFDQHPQESQALINHPSPFHAAVEHYRRQKFLAEVNDPDKWREAERERIRQEILAEAQATQPSKPNAPPPSMSKAPAAGGNAIAPGNAFDAMLPD